MINFTLLDENQKIWLNRYNQIIRGKVIEHSHTGFFRILESLNGKAGHFQIWKECSAHWTMT